MAPGTRIDLTASGSDRSSFEEDGLLERERTARPTALGSHTVWGFYAYSVASETFSIVALSLFIPVLLEQLARENGYLAPNHTVPCPPSSSVPIGGEEELRCLVQIFGAWVDTASFALFVFSSSVAVQALVVISLGAVAEDPHMRHRLLILLAFLGSLMTMTFILIPSSSSIWSVSGLLALGANVCFGSSIVCLNSYLPELARGTAAVMRQWDIMEEARETHKRLRHSAGADDILTASQALVNAEEQYITKRGQATSQISSNAVAAAYSAGILALVVLLVPVTLMKGSTLSLQIAIAGSGLFWAIGTIPAAIWLRPAHTAIKFSRPQPSVRASIAQSWRGLFVMILEWRRLPATFVFLAAWFLLSDGFSTFTSTAMLFAKTTMGMSTDALIAISILSPLAGIGGAVMFPVLQKRVLNWSNLSILQLLVALAGLIPVWGLLALRTQWQMYFIAMLFGAIFGGFQSYARSVFSEIVPSSQAARFFGLMSSSFIGPLLVGVLGNMTGSIRNGFYLILLMFVLALPVLHLVNMDTGRADAETYQRQVLEQVLEEED